MNLNKVFLIGRLTQDPESRSTNSGQNVTTIRMATNRVWYDPQTREKREATEFHSVIAWARLGEIAAQYLKKGSTVLIEGRLQTRSWDDKNTGQKRYMTEIVAENLQLGPRPQGGGSYQNGGPRDVSDIKPAPVGRAPKKSEPEPEIPVINEDTGTNMGLDEEPEQIKDSDLPF
ncbi:MAG TPA: single-stranded DNA-binding protein [Candidatus Paceibacterota bacterium]|nr:single-stranded DNA-binding protein [Candidatus Paceibacterota bacterium]